MNMLTMLKAENEVSADELSFSRFIKNLNELLGYAVDENGIAFDLYSDGCSPAEAAEEIKAQ